MSADAPLLRIGWRDFLGRRRDVAILLLSFAALAAVLLACLRFLAFNETRQGFVVDDPVLARFRPVAVSNATFLITYLSLACGWVLSARTPWLLVRVAQAYAILTVLRMICMFLVPLEPPPALIPLDDPVLRGTVYAGGQNVKDLFFSGHTATIALFGFVFSQPVLKAIYFAAAAAVGVLVVAQHVHYSIDVIAAPLAAYAALRLQKRLRP